MKKQISILLLLILALCISFCTVTTAQTEKTASYTVSSAEGMDKLSEYINNIADQVTAVMITVTGDLDGTSDAWKTKSGVTYTVSGPEYSLYQVNIQGEGTVILNVKTIEGNKKSAFTVSGRATVRTSAEIVKETVRGTNTKAQPTVTADENATLSVTGTITGGNVKGYNSVAGTGVKASGNASVTVTGNVTGGTWEDNYGHGGIGVDASGASTVKITGDVTGGTGATGGDAVNAEGQATVEVNGNIVGGAVQRNSTAGDGISLKDAAKITVTGNVAGGSGGLAGCGIYGTDCNGAEIRIKGNVSGGNGAENTVATAGTGICIDGDKNKGTVLVDGNVTGGNGTPGGNGISAQGVSLTVKGNVIGGNTTETDGTAGNGIVITIQSSEYTFEEGFDAGSITVEGTVSGGSTNGTALYYTVHSDILAPLTPGITLEGYSAWNPDNTPRSFCTYLLDNIRRMKDDGYLTHEDINTFDTVYYRMLAEIAGITLPGDFTPAGEAGQALILQIETVISGMEQTEVNSAITEKHQQLLNSYGIQTDKVLQKLLTGCRFPTVTAGVLSDKNGGMTASEIRSKLPLETANQNIFYTISIITPENGTLTADKTIVKAGETVTFTAAANKGYAVDTVSVSGTPLSRTGSQYTFIAGMGGNLQATATFQVLQTPEPPEEDRDISTNTDPQTSSAEQSTSEQTTDTVQTTDDTNNSDPSGTEQSTNTASETQKNPTTADNHKIFYIAIAILIFAAELCAVRLYRTRKSGR